MHPPGNGSGFPEKGVSGLCFTDHYDVVDGSGALVPAYDWYPARQAHRETLEALPGDFMLLYGLELGNVTADFAAGDKALQEPGLDFVLGSIHNAGPAFHRQDYYLSALPVRSSAIPIWMNILPSWKP